MANLAVLLVGP